mgnify:FL=1
MSTSEQLQQKRHTLAHLLVSAVKQLWPGSQNAIGPAIENGFYQDFEIAGTITDEDLPKIQQRMIEILPTWDVFEGRNVTPEQARELYSWNKYKLEMIEDLASHGEQITFYKSGDLDDLCRGGHSEHPAHDINPKAFKLTHVAGAYWRGDEKNKMLTRIYGLAFDTKDELQKHLAMLEEAKKRDHRKLGQYYDLFTHSDLVGKGLPLFTPKGTILRETLNEFSQKLRAEKGWQKVWSPHITKNDLYKTSGHWDKFGGELFLVKSQETSDELVMKPMNCPHHQQIYASRPRSYRDLPIKYMETTTVYRDEKAGELLGLSRVRCITQDDGHAFCMPSQIEQIYGELIEVTKTFYDVIGMKLRARLSFRDPVTPEKYLGEIDLWEQAQSILLDVAKKQNLDYFIAEGEAAFYGPKIDFMGIDAIGREWQLATPQLDFVQPKRFGLTYINDKGTEQTPVMIHFALMGSIERFLSVYIEHTAGHFPLWLAPVQVVVASISDKQLEYATEIVAGLREADIRVELNGDNEKIGKKIRDSEMMKVPYLVILGDKEIEAKKIAVRKRGGEDLGQLELESWIKTLKQEIESKSL